MKYGKERRYRWISGRNIARTADVLGMTRSALVTTMSEMARRLPAAFEVAVADVPADMVTDQLLTMPARISAFADEFVRRVRGEDLSVRAIPRFQGQSAAGWPATRRIWDPGGWSRGRWVTGRYRNRPVR